MVVVVWLCGCVVVWLCGCVVCLVVWLCVCVSEAWLEVDFISNLRFIEEFNREI